MSKNDMIPMAKIGEHLIALDAMPADLRRAWEHANSRLEITVAAEKASLNAETYNEQRAARKALAKVTDEIKVRMASTLLLKAAPRIGLRWPVKQLEK